MSIPLIFCGKKKHGKSDAPPQTWQAITLAITADTRSTHPRLENVYDQEEAGLVVGEVQVQAAVGT